MSKLHFSLPDELLRNIFFGGDANFRLILRTFSESLKPLGECFRRGFKNCTLNNQRNLRRKKIRFNKYLFLIFFRTFNGEVFRFQANTFSAGLSKMQSSWSVEFLWKQTFWAKIFILFLFPDFERKFFQFFAIASSCFVQITLYVTRRSLKKPFCSRGRSKLLYLISDFNRKTMRPWRKTFGRAVEIAFYLSGINLQRKHLGSKNNIFILLQGLRMENFSDFRPIFFRQVCQKRNICVEKKFWANILFERNFLLCVCFWTLKEDFSNIW